MPGLYTNYLEKTGLVQPSFHPWAQPSLMEIWHSGSTTRVTPRHRTGPFLLSGQRGTGLTAWRIRNNIWTLIFAIQIMFCLPKFYLAVNHNILIINRNTLVIYTYNLAHFLGCGPGVL